MSLCLGLFAFSPADAQQPITTTVICNSAATCAPTVSGAVAATLRRPATDTLGRAHVGIFVMHPYSSYVNNSTICNELAARGFTTLCANGPFNGNQFGYYGYEQHIPTIAAGLNYLRNSVTGPAITKALIFGHSAGAPMMTLYQNVAENGPAACTGPEKIIPCVTAGLSGIPKADGVMLFDAHLGDSLATYTYIDPAVIGNTLGNRDPSLDMFSAANGYNAASDGATYTDAFKKRYTAAQAIRNNDLISQALDLLQQRRIQTGNPDDMGDAIPFTIVGGNAARLWQPDLSLLKCTQRAHTLLARDGTRPSQIVCSVRVPSGQRSEGLTSASTLNINVHIFLGAHALRSNGRYTQTINDITGLDYLSSSDTSAANVPFITVPIIIISNSGHYFLRPDEIIYDAAASFDKTLAYEEGAVHGGTPCDPCANAIGQPNGYFGDTVKRTMDFYGEWLAARY
ncbi:MAG TPA: hypothetical protein VIB79_24420 [Candidatus Binatia bacterium]